MDNNRQMNKIEQENDLLKHSLDQLSSKLKEKCDLFDQSQQQLRQLTKDYEEGQQIIATLRKQSKEMQEQKLKWQEEQEHLQAEIEELKKVNFQQEGKISDLQGQLNKLHRMQDHQTKELRLSQTNWGMFIFGSDQKQKLTLNQPTDHAEDKLNINDDDFMDLSKILRRDSTKNEIQNSQEANQQERKQNILKTELSSNYKSEKQYAYQYQQLEKESLQLRKINEELQQKIILNDQLVTEPTDRVNDYELRTKELSQWVDIKLRKESESMEQTQNEKEKELKKERDIKSEQYEIAKQIIDKLRNQLFSSKIKNNKIQQHLEELQDNYNQLDQEKRQLEVKVKSSQIETMYQNQLEQHCLKVFKHYKINNPQNKIHSMMKKISQQLSSQ